MTRDEAADWIRGRPAQYQGWTVDQVLAKVQSHTDPSYYDPSLFAPDGPPPAAAPRPKPAAAAPRPAPKAPAPITTASLVPSVPGVPKSVWVLGALAAAGLAFRKRIARAL